MIACVRWRLWSALLLLLALLAPMANPWHARAAQTEGPQGVTLEQVGYGRDEILRRLRHLKPASSFRSQYAYSNFGLTEGAIAAAKATGKSWEDVAAEKLYRPLGMSSTSSRFADYEAAPNRALIHVLVNDAWVPRLTRNANAQSPAGGVSSTARDLAQWMRLELGNGRFDGELMINSDALAQTHLPQIIRGSNLVTGQPAFYGLGWNVDYDEQGRIFWSHAGAFSLGARTLVELLPSEDLGIVVLTNAFPTGVPEAIAADFYDLVLKGQVTRDWIQLWNEPFDALVQSFYAASRAYATPPAQIVPAQPPSAYIGTYTNDYFGDIEVSEKDGALVLQLGPDKHAFPLRHWDRDVFLYEPDAEFPGAVSGVKFGIGPGQQAQQVVLENFNDDDQGTFTRVLAGR